MMLLKRIVPMIAAAAYLGAGLTPFWAFTIGVIVNVPLGIVLSAVTFKDYWMKIG